jgi:hypothetical protein
MSDPVDPQPPSEPPVEPVPVHAPPTANEPVFAEPAPSPAGGGDDDDFVTDGLTDATEYEVVTTAPWVSLVTVTGFCLAVLVVLLVAIFLTQGLAASGSGFTALHRIGSGFYNNLDSSQLEILLIVATILLALPAIGDQATSDRQDRAAALGLAVTSAFAVIVGVAAVLAVLFELKYFHLQSPGQKLPSTAQRLLAGYVVRHVGLSVIALVAALSAMKARFAPPPEVADEVADNPELLETE